MKNITRLALVALLLAAGTAVTRAAAEPALAPNRLFTGADLFGLEYANDPQISPDGRAVAYVRRSNDIMTDRTRSSVWQVDVATGEQHPLLSESGTYSSPRWSPDGTRLAYIASEGGASQLYVRWLASGESARITGLADTPGAIAWSPDGRRIAFTMFVSSDEARFGSAPEMPEGAKWADPLQAITAVTFRTDEEGYLKSGYEQIFSVPADGGAPRQLTFGPGNVGGDLSWTADGRSILFGANLSKTWDTEPVNSEVYRVSLDGGQPVALTDQDGPDERPKVSPDGRYVAYTGFADRKNGFQNTQLSVMNLDGSGKHVVSRALDESVENYVWAPDSRSLLIAYMNHGDNALIRIGLDGSLTALANGFAGSEIDRPYIGGIGGAGQLSIAQNGTLAMMVGDFLHPANIAVVNGSTVRQLTHLGDALLGPKALAQIQKLLVKSNIDQRPIDAWMVTPPGFDPSKKYPMILEIHGGPYAAYGPEFSTDYQLYAAHDYVVVFSNPRGSTSYGERFADLIDQAYPGHDYDDLMSVVDAAIASGHIDPDNLFVTGGSGGGILTAWIVGKTHRFRAAVAQKPAVNFASFTLTSDGTGFYSPYWFLKRPWEDPVGYWARSPLSLVGNVTTPTMLVVGSEDYRTPESESEQYYKALMIRGVPSAFIRVPGASHSGIAARPSQSAARASAILAWFDKYRFSNAGGKLGNVH